MVIIHTGSHICKTALRALFTNRMNTGKIGATGVYVLNRWPEDTVCTFNLTSPGDLLSGLTDARKSRIGNRITTLEAVRVWRWDDGKKLTLV